jgi:2-phosphosulfolactate phosphatase
MGGERDVRVHLTPELAPTNMTGCVAVAIDVLRATTTIVQALASGCVSVRPCAEIEQAKALAGSLPAGKTLLGGERGGLPLPGFDLGNSPREYTAKRCRGMTLVLTTSNGTRAIARALAADRVLIAAFVNFTAVCEQLRHDARPLHIVCAGSEGAPCLEDTLLAGAIVDYLCDEYGVKLNDSARLAWDCFENHGRILAGALEVSGGGEHLKSIGCGDDLPLAAEVDKYPLAPEVRRDPLRIEVGSISVAKSRWRP